MQILCNEHRSLELGAFILDKNRAPRPLPVTALLLPMRFISFVQKFEYCLAAMYLGIVRLHSNHPNSFGNHCHLHAHVHSTLCTLCMCAYVWVSYVYWWWKPLQPPSRLELQLLLVARSTRCRRHYLHFALHPIRWSQTLSQLRTPRPQRSVVLRHLFKFEALPAELSLSCASVINFPTAPSEYPPVPLCRNLYPASASSKLRLVRGRLAPIASLGFVFVVGFGLGCVSLIN